MLSVTQRQHSDYYRTGSVYFLDATSRSGTLRQVKCILQVNPPTWYPPFLEYVSVWSSMASTIGHRTLLLSSLILDKIGSILKTGKNKRKMYRRIKETEGLVYKQLQGISYHIRLQHARKCSLKTWNTNKTGGL